MASTYLICCEIIQPGGVGIVRFFRQADRPGESRLVAAVVAAVAVAAVVLAGDSALPRLSGMIAAATAYLSNGQYATTIPSDNNGLVFFSSWLWRGAHGH
jgi:hypothetical protein